MKEKKKENYGEHFRNMRLKKYPTQDSFSIAAECSREFVSQFENNKTDISLTMLKKMAAALDMPTYKFVQQLLNE